MQQQPNQSSQGGWPQPQWPPQQQPWPSQLLPPQQEMYSQPVQPPLMQQPPAQPPKKRGKGLWIGLAVLVAVLVLFGVIGSNASKSTPNTGTAINTPSTSGNSFTPSTSSNTPAPTNQHFAVGQVVKVGDTWEVTINSVKTNTGSEFSRPQYSGNVFLLFSITVKNLSSQEQVVSSALNFSLLDASGQKYTETIDPSAGATLNGKVAANSPLKGSIVYEVPASTHQYRLAFEADIVSSGQTIWDIHV